MEAELSGYAKMTVVRDRHCPVGGFSGIRLNHTTGNVYCSQLLGFVYFMSYEFYNV